MILKTRTSIRRFLCYLKSLLLINNLVSSTLNRMERRSFAVLKSLVLGDGGVVAVGEGEVKLLPQESQLSLVGPVGKACVTVTCLTLSRLFLTTNSIGIVSQLV